MFSVLYSTHTHTLNTYTLPSLFCHKQKMKTITRKLSISMHSEQKIILLSAVLSSTNNKNKINKYFLNIRAIFTFKVIFNFCFSLFFFLILTQKKRRSYLLKNRLYKIHNRCIHAYFVSVISISVCVCVCDVTDDNDDVIDENVHKKCSINE